MWMLERFYDELTNGIPDRNQIQPVNITAASQWFYESNEKDFADWENDFPIVVPPFPITWMEFKTPKYIKTTNGIIAFPNSIESIGCMVFCIPIEEEERATAIESNAMTLGKTDWDTPENIAKRNEDAISAGHTPQWITYWHSAVLRAGKIIRDAGVVNYINTEGKFITENYLQMYKSDDTLNNESWLTPFLFATSLMHAKNVSLGDDALPAAVQKRRQKEGKRTITFKTLRIDPIRQQAKRERTDSSSEQKRAMHIVRGHFKDYRNSAGLFGKLKGLYWWDMHVAGDISAGQVVKDYEIARVRTL